MQEKTRKPRARRRATAASAYPGYAEAILLQDIREGAAAAEADLALLPPPGGDPWIEEFRLHLGEARDRALPWRP